MFTHTRPICDISLDTILYGDDTLSLEENMNIFSYVHCYIEESKHFT